MRSQTVLALLIGTILTAAPSLAAPADKTIQITTGDTRQVLTIPEEPVTPPVAPAAAQKLLELSPVEVDGRTVPGTYRLTAGQFGLLPPLKTNRKLKIVSGDLADGDTLVLLQLRNPKKQEDPKQFDLCETIGTGEDTIRPALVRCGESYLVDGGLLALRTKSGTLYPLAQVPNRIAPTWGTDVGFALTILKESDKEQGYHFFDGATVYYSVARLGPFLRAVANLAALDMVETEDFETGLGLGLMLRGPDGEDDQGLSLVAGMGYNFMLDGADHPDPWYYYIGFGWNFGREEN